MPTLDDDFRDTLLKTTYDSDDVRSRRRFLADQGTFDVPILPTGLFSAAPVTAESEYTGYHNVWVRDNIHVAHSLFVQGQIGAATASVTALTGYFRKHRRRFEAIIDDPGLAGDPMNRPHIRFNGESLEENAEKWSHAQNDALGYYVWFYCKLALAGHITVSTSDLEMLALFPLYFNAVGYWQDEDSGHWEEARKISASSIGAVVAGLEELLSLMATQPVAEIETPRGSVTFELLESLLEKGRAALFAILPHECVQPDPAKRRLYDSALLFLIYPLGIVTGGMAERILGDIEGHLRGDYGVRRYLGDSFWCANYKELQDESMRTGDFSSDVSGRDALLQPGQEAQWCIFDPILSAYYGRSYVETGDRSALDKQIYYFNRSLNQLTKAGGAFPAYRCPELYYLERGAYVPNDVTPLLWTQANLGLAFVEMQKSADREQSLIYK